MKSARNVRIYQPPKNDFEHFVNATPGVNRMISYEVEEIDSKDQLKLTDSDVIVFNRPKYFIRSNGSLWASEYEATL